MTLTQAAIQQLSFKNTLGLLALLFFTVQPWDRHLADALWLATSLTSFMYISIKKCQGHLFNIPKPLKTLIWLFTLMPVVSVISYLASPLDNLTARVLEPDTRWLLIIPIIIALRDTQISPKWVLALICSYAVSSFLSAFIETSYLTELWKRANGDENSVPYGMFNSTIAAMILAFYLSPYITQDKKHKSRLLKPLVLFAFILASTATLLSGSRAAMLLIPLVVIALYLLNFNVKKSIKKLIIILGVGTILVSLQSESAFMKRMVGIQDRVASYFVIGDKTSRLHNQRLEQWNESLCIFTKQPILGTGPRSFKQAHQAFGGEDQCDALQFLPQGSYQAHSVYFNTLSTLGLTGTIISLILVLAFMHIAFQAFRQQSKTENLGGSLLIAVIICHIINGLTLDLWFMNHVMNKNLIALALPLTLIYSKKIN